MAQRREQSTALAGITTLMVSSGLGAEYTYKGNKESTLGRSYAPYSRGDAAVQHKLAAHNGELSTRCDDTFPERMIGGVSGQMRELLQNYLKIKKDKVVALRTNLNPMDGGSTEVQNHVMKQDDNQKTGFSSWTHLRPGSASASSFGRVCNWAHASPGFLEHLENMWKRKAFREGEQEDLDSFKYTMSLKTEQQMKALNRSQLTEYIRRLHKDNEYIGQLAVDSKTKIQRMSAEIESLSQQVQSLKQELEVQAALYLDKMNRPQHKAM